MPWPWNERTVLIEAEEAILLPDVASEGKRWRCRHHGKPAQALAMLLGGAARARPGATACMCCSAIHGRIANYCRGRTVWPGGKRSGAPMRWA